MMNVKFLTIFLFCNAALLTSIFIALACQMSLFQPSRTIADGRFALAAFPGGVVFTNVKSRLFFPFVKAFSVAKLTLFVFGLIRLTRKFIAAIIANHFNFTVVRVIFTNEVFRHPLATAFVITKEIFISINIRLASRDWFFAMSALNNDAVIIVMFCAFLVFSLTLRPALYVAIIAFVPFNFIFITLERLSAIIAFYCQHLFTYIKKESPIDLAIVVQAIARLINGRHEKIARAFDCLNDGIVAL